MIEIEYRIELARRQDFAGAVEALGRLRRRAGAFFWAHFVDVGDPARNVEVFLVESWLQHLRQHDRMTIGDRAIQERVTAFHIAAEPPKVLHLVAGTSSRNPKWTPSNR